MRSKLVESSGQTLIFVALLMVVFLALLALAIDVGLVYQERRGMQNAADAGALAGAREICYGDYANNNDRVGGATATARDYAITRNEAEEADVRVALSGINCPPAPVPPSGTVSVTARTTARLFFARVLGMSELTIGAQATAACWPATSGCGLWPVAFHDDLWSGVFSASCSAGATPDTVYIWAGYHSGKQNCDNPDSPSCYDTCADPSKPQCKNPDCVNVYNCDMSNPKDGVDDVFADTGRAWLDFSGFEDPDNPGGGDCPKNGCGTAELGYCIAGSPNVKINLPACISGDMGVKGGAKQEVQARKGDVVGIPIFEQFCPNPGECHGGYWITSVGCVKVDNNKPWLHLKLKPKPGVTAPDWHGWVIAASVVCTGCNTNCGGTGYPSETGTPGGLRGVSLIR